MYRFKREMEVSMLNIFKYIENKKALLIDIDNTIINYSHSHKVAMNFICNRYDFNINEYEEAKSEVKALVSGVNSHKKELYFKKIIEKKNLKYSLFIRLLHYIFLI